MRINCGIPVENLTDEHLMAEHREIKMLPYFVNKSELSGSNKKIPKRFTLNKGHILFFTNKVGFVINRYKNIHNECIKRNLFPVDYLDKLLSVDKKYCGDYIPQDRDRQILEERISSRIITSTKPYFHYYSQRITKIEAIKILKGKKII